MKTLRNQLLLAVACLLVIPSGLLAQEEQPAFVILTKVHFNFDNQDGTPEDWLALEKEYHEKVIMKNEFIRGAGVMVHYFTADNSESILIRTYNSWEDIEKAQTRSMELEEEGWTEEAADSYFARRNAYYLPQHSDEILRVVPGAKPVEDFGTEPLVYYMQVHQLAFPEDGSPEDFTALSTEYYEAVAHKNPLIKGFYVGRHGWGSDNRDLVEVRVVEKLADIASAGDETVKLEEANWPDEAERDAFFEKVDKYFTGKHADYIFRNVPELNK